MPDICGNCDAFTYRTLSFSRNDPAKLLWPLPDTTLSLKRMNPGMGSCKMKLPLPVVAIDTRPCALTLERVMGPVDERFIGSDVCRCSR
jgi:hypothetical protein